MTGKTKLPESTAEKTEKMPDYSNEVIMAMEEAKVLSTDPSATRYQSFHDALNDSNN